MTMVTVTVTDASGNVISKSEQGGGSTYSSTSSSTAYSGTVKVRTSGGSEYYMKKEDAEKLAAEGKLTILSSTTSKTTTNATGAKIEAVYELSKALEFGYLYDKGGGVYEAPTEHIAQHMEYVFKEGKSGEYLSVKREGKTISLYLKEPQAPQSQTSSTSTTTNALPAFSGSGIEEKTTQTQDVISRMFGPTPDWAVWAEKNKPTVTENMTASEAVTAAKEAYTKGLEKSQPVSTAVVYAKIPDPDKSQKELEKNISYQVFEGVEKTGRALKEYSEIARQSGGPIGYVHAIAPGFIGGAMEDIGYHGKQYTGAFVEHWEKPTLSTTVKLVGATIGDMGIIGAETYFTASAPIWIGKSVGGVVSATTKEGVGAIAQSAKNFGEGLTTPLISKTATVVTGKTYQTAEIIERTIVSTGYLSIAASKIGVNVPIVSEIGRGQEKFLGMLGGTFTGQATREEREDIIVGFTLMNMPYYTMKLASPHLASGSASAKAVELLYKGMNVGAVGLVGYIGYKQTGSPLAAYGYAQANLGFSDIYLESKTIDTHFEQTKLYKGAQAVAEKNIAAGKLKPSEYAMRMSGLDLKFDMKPDFKPDVAKADYKPDLRPDIRPDTKPDIRHDYRVDYKPDYKPDYKIDLKTDFKPDIKPDIKPDYKPDEKPDYRIDLKPDAKPDYKPDTKPDYKIDLKIDNEPFVLPPVIPSLPLGDSGADIGGYGLVGKGKRKEKLLDLITVDRMITRKMGW